MAETKMCRGCWQLKPLSDFERRTIRQCRACRATRRNENRRSQKARDPEAFKRKRKAESGRYYIKNRIRLIESVKARYHKLVYDGAGMIWTTSEVQSFEAISPFDWFQLPAEQQWIKSKPNVVATARQKTQLIYSYTECKQATALLYDAFGSAALLDA